ncbi:alpha/beta fold hydrolase [Oleomonas cavernae]|uniref:Alpha/beta fold hydrolase n=1 Tax=Oleomonas cavernae TaxID=2320859 RepID=A0A418WGX2_9PROT|nr:alpha/beta fold hydrolase [Oleomonas cavernae]RJF89212.1 alpha/beta fold hydrolase [Oleomonas cavernae]
MTTLPDGYRGQEAWRNIQSFLPAEYQLGPDREPQEEWWDWRGHRIHLDRFWNPAAKFRVILFHGVGTNGRQMSTILGAPLHQSGLEAVAIDMPGYGVTKVARGAAVSYDDWVEAASDFINAELARDPRPIVLYGLSAGGMLAYHAAALNRKVKGIVGMTFLDQRIQRVGDETAANLVMSRAGLPMAHLSTALGLGAIRLPMFLVSKMRALVNDRAALDACLSDRTSAGNWVSLKFLSSYARYRPEIEPEAFDICPILLTQPAEDRWTPLSLSELFLSRIRKVPVTTVMLENAGHYPIEQPGLRQMHDAIVAFVNRCCPPTSLSRFEN